MGLWTLWNQFLSLSYLRRTRRTITNARDKGSADMAKAEIDVPATQSLLLLHAPRQDYVLTYDHPVPATNANHEVLVRVHAIGLNPIDWKAPDFNFGIPELPYISGRELVGEVVKICQPSSRLALGDRVLVVSTDYRDLRKGAYQQYAVSADFNVAKLPRSLSTESGASLGVAFVAAALALGICLGVDFSTVRGGPDLIKFVRKLDEHVFPLDIRTECREGINEDERAKPGDWIAIWGGSSTTAILATQLAQLAGLRVINIVDQAKHGARFAASSRIRPDVLIDSHDVDRVAHIIRDVTGNSLRFGIDTRGRDTAALLLRSLTREGEPGSTDTQETPSRQQASHPLIRRSHLVGLTGIPKQQAPQDTIFHTVPIKLFHEVPPVGEALMSWLERLLADQTLRPPEVLGIEEGFDGVNRGLARMRRGEISGGRLVVRLPVDRSRKAEKTAVATVAAV